MRRLGLAMMLGLAMTALAGSGARAQVPVRDDATLQQATTTASNTASIMNSNQQILTTVNQTLQAVTGNRDTGSVASSALGSGFSASSAPSLTSILGGGAMSWGNLGSNGTVATNIINGLNLVQTLTGNNGGQLTGPDSAYQGAVNTSAAITGVISGTQQAATTRSSAFNSAASQIGTQTDIKASIDTNSQWQAQTALTVNEVIGAVNSTNAVINAQQMQELAAQAKASQVMQYQ